MVAPPDANNATPVRDTRDQRLTAPYGQPSYLIKSSLHDGLIGKPPPSRQALYASEKGDATRHPANPCAAPHLHHQFPNINSSKRQGSRQVTSSTFSGINIQITQNENVVAYEKVDTQLSDPSSCCWQFRDAPSRKLSARCPFESPPLSVFVTRTKQSEQSPRRCVFAIWAYDEQPERCP